VKTLAFLALASLVACATTDDAAIVPDDATDGDKADGLFGPPRGVYTYEATLSGLPESGDILRLELTPSGQFQLEVSDELSGTTQHRGTYHLFKTGDDIHHFIDFTEGSQSNRFEWSIDPVDLDTLWLEQISSQRIYGMSHLGDDCATGGCGEGATCSECFGENVCMPSGASC